MDQLKVFILLAPCAIVCFVVMHRRYWHPLAPFPGPFWASVTDLWNAKAWAAGNEPYAITELHAKYGPIVRYGPNRLSVTSSDAVDTIYVKGFKTMPKTEFYSTFGNPRFPHLFMTRDAALHARHRRLFLKAFAPRAVTTYEPLIDSNIRKVIAKIAESADSGKPFDLKKLIYLFMCDTIATLVYGCDLGILVSEDVSRLPDDHLLAQGNAVFGSLPATHLWAPYLLALIPHPRTRPWFRNTVSYVLEGVRHIDRRKKELDKQVNLEKGDLLTLTMKLVGDQERVIEQSKVSYSEATSELVSFIFAGTHPPAATMNMLLWHLLHNPQIMQNTVHEIERNLPTLNQEKPVYTNAEVEACLPYFKSCVKESARLTPVFAMPLARYVTDESTMLSGHLIPKGTSVAMSNHAFHHNPEVWGLHHNVFDPHRWDDESGSELSKMLMHFGAGGRQCIGKALATALINKLTSTLLSNYKLQLADKAEYSKALDGAFHGKLPNLKSNGISDLVEPLNVMAYTLQH